MVSEASSASIGDIRGKPERIGSYQVCMETLDAREYIDSHTEHVGALAEKRVTIQVRKCKTVSRYSDVIRPETSTLWGEQLVWDITAFLGLLGIDV